MGFAQVLIQARGEGAAHNGVQYLEREPVGGRARRAHVADPDHGLRRAWFVDQIQRARRRRRGGRARERRHLAPLPAAEPRGREPAYFGERDVAHDQQARPVGPVVRPIELSDALTREPGGGAVRAVQRVPVRMLATVHDRRERDVRHRHRLVSLLHQLRGAELSLPCDLRIGEAGPQHHVGEQIEPGLEPPLGHVDRGARPVEGRRRAELGAEERGFVSDVQGAARACALLQHGRREGGKPGYARWVARRAGVVQLLLDAGAARDPSGVPGLATFTATMLQQGAGARSALDVADEAAFLGAQLGTTASFDGASASIHVPKRRLEAGLDLLADVVLRPSFADSEIARQRELRAAQLVQQRDEPVAVASIAFPAIVYGRGHPYGHPLNGTDSATARLARDGVAEFYGTYYRPNGARLLIVGDVTLADARRLAAARFGGWERRDVTAFPSPPTPPRAAARTVYLIDKPGAAQSVVRIGHVGPVRTTPDWFALEVLNTIVGGAFTSRLNQNLRETHGYTYGAFSQFAPRRLTGAFVALASVVTAKTDSSLIEFLKELRRIRDETVAPRRGSASCSRSACRSTTTTTTWSASTPSPPPTCSAWRASTSTRTTSTSWWWATRVRSRRASRR